MIRTCFSRAGLPRYFCRQLDMRMRMFLQNSVVVIHTKYMTLYSTCVDIVVQTIGMNNSLAGDFKISM